MSCSKVRFVGIEIIDPASYIWQDILELHMVVEVVGSILGQRKAFDYDLVGVGVDSE